MVLFLLFMYWPTALTFFIPPVLIIDIHLFIYIHITLVTFNLLVQYVVITYNRMMHRKKFERVL